MQKLGEGAKPFTLCFPQSSPNSVLIKGEEGDSAQMGVSYEVKLHIGDSSDDFVGSKKSSVNMSIRKVHYVSFAKYFCRSSPNDFGQNQNILDIGPKTRLISEIFCYV